MSTCAEQEIHVNDIGTVFELTVMDGNSVVDLSSSSTKNFIFKSPSATDTKGANFVTNGEDGKLTYTTVSGDLDVAGDWQLQVKVTLPAGTWYSTIYDFEVVANLA